MAEKASIHIDRLIDVVNQGGRVKTGIDVFNKEGVLLIEKDVMLGSPKPLETIKECGIIDVPIDPAQNGGIWDAKGVAISLDKDVMGGPVSSPEATTALTGVSATLKEITDTKREASIRYEKAKKTMQQVILQIREKGGEFDYHRVENTVSELLEFMESRPNAFGYLAKSIFRYDDYLYNHSVNVCTIGTAVLLHFNNHFSGLVNTHIHGLFQHALNPTRFMEDQGFVYYLPSEIAEISTAYFLHDIGKVLIPEAILNKKGSLTPGEFDLVKTHSFEKGRRLLDKNGISASRVVDMAMYHHAALFTGEANTYPGDKTPPLIPIHVKIGKLADIYDAITSKRAYKDALNPVLAVTEVFRKYANRSLILQFLVHSFVKSIGVYPPGSVVRLTNGQMALVLDGVRPIVLPFTDTTGQTLSHKPDPLDLTTPEAQEKGLNIDRREAMKSPIEAYQRLPAYLKSVLEGE